MCGEQVGDGLRELDEVASVVLGIPVDEVSSQRAGYLLRLSNDPTGVGAMLSREVERREALVC